MVLRYSGTNFNENLIVVVEYMERKCFVCVPLCEVLYFVLCGAVVFCYEMYRVMPCSAWYQLAQ